MKPLSFATAAELAKARGFTFRKASGSHYIYRDGVGRRVVIPLKSA
jgi:predicted RNA binding protein YcfA (HicA-like mRNA interferase family)